MKRKIISCLILLVVAGTLTAQSNDNGPNASVSHSRTRSDDSIKQTPGNNSLIRPGDSIPKTRSYYSLAIGTGWSHYFSDFQTVSARDVGKDFVGISLRFLWEPEYLLSLGLETGFYRVYRVKKTLNAEYTMDSRMYIMPLMLVVRMKIINHLYLSVAPGLALQISQISGIGDNVDTHQFSYANFEACASYLYPISKKFELGGEARLFYIGVTNDYITSLNAVIAVIL
jgi:hypothetical protein